MLQDICAAVERGKKQGWNKEQLLLELAKIPGVYVPSFYDVTYREDGRIEAVTPNRARRSRPRDKGHRQGYGQLHPAGKLRCAARRCGAGPRLRRGAARLRARLPLLSGRPALPPLP